MKTFLYLALTTATCLAQVAPAPRILRILTPADIDPGRLLPPPAPDGSESQQRELTELKRILKDRTPERFKQAQWDNENENPMVFASVIGASFDLKKLPETAKLLEIVENDQKIAATTAKDYFKRRFAAVVDTSIVPLTCDPADVRALAAQPGGRKLRSYPSGHATMGYTMAVVLSALIPERSQAILSRAADYAYSREVCGDHYHSDVEASHGLGNSIGTMLLRNPSLQSRIEAAKTELKAARITQNLN